jgi:methylenetetrahydrofolate reductase (NADPH)
MPLTSLRRLARLGELTGVEPAPELIERLAAADTDAERTRIGVSATVDLANAALDAGAPGIHLYTFNEHAAALDVLDKLALPRPRSGNKNSGNRHSGNKNSGNRHTASRRQLAS